MATTYTVPVPMTLFDVAASQMGDALCWWQIAALNGISDTNLAAGMVLAIPSTGTPDNDGLPPQ